jgi:AcrR family transcriptional regulator
VPKSSKAAPQPKQSRAHSTIETVVTEARKALLEGGEASVRIQDISARAKVSIGSIYHHFGDRDGLIRATYVHNFASSVREDIAKVKRFMANLHTTQEIAKHYDEMFEFLTDHFGRLPASERAAIIGNTTGRPLLRQALAEVQNELTNGLTEVMQMLHDRKMLKSHLTPRAAATVVLGLLHGRVIAELDTDPVAEAEWNKAMLSAFSGLFQNENAVAV